MEHQNAIKDVSPTETWAALADGNYALVDCRTAHEWNVIGVPDLSELGKTVYRVEWKQAPDMSINPEFKTELEQALGGTLPERIYFICRSGARSKEAATYIQDALSSSDSVCECINVAEGFEGDPDASGIRGQINGWQARGLPWAQG